MNYNLEFYTQYGQFYICDKNATGSTGSDDFWTDDAQEERLALEDGIIGVAVVGYTLVKAALHLLASKVAEINYDLYDHIVEGGLDCSSGIIQVAGCPDTSIEFEKEVKPGSYRVRVYMSDLKSSIKNNEDNVKYKIEIWPDDNIERKVLKQL